MWILLLFSAWALAGTMPALGTETSTLGQPVIGIAEGHSWTIYSGFWYVEPLSGIEETDSPSEIPTQRWTTIVSSGPYVNVAGASELVDATGRVIENAIEDNKVFISNLPTGTYFARNGERTIVKIVKVE
ncbi:hypothetical protein ES703_52188 [subsurface metagenome]